MVYNGGRDSMKRKKFSINIILGLLAILLLTIVVATINLDTTENVIQSEDGMYVYFLDVGQGDATLLRGPDFTILVDTGDHRRNDVVPYLKELGVTEIDLLVGTHPHADHIGQFDKVLDNFPVKEVWMDGNSHTTRTFERAIDAIARSNANYYEPRAGEVFQFGSLLIEVYNPDSLTGKFHDDCIALKAIYKDFSVFLTGDIEKPIELKMIDNNYPLRATILQLGHHGSRTSSSAEFLKAVKPDVAIYSAGVNNDYGHPHREVMDLLEDLNIPVYGTDVHGTIAVYTDGKSYEIKTTNK